MRRGDWRLKLGFWVSKFYAIDYEPKLPSLISKLYLRMPFLYHLSDIDQAAQWLLTNIGTARVVCFHGQMGAGKTTLIIALCKQLGMQGSFSSPTFPIINEYARSGGGVIHHMDLYRLNSVEEAERAGVVDALYSDALSLVEWPDRLPQIIPENAIHVQLQMVDAEMRSLQVVDAGQ